MQDSQKIMLFVKVRQPTCLLFCVLTWAECNKKPQAPWGLRFAKIYTDGNRSTIHRNKEFLVVAGAAQAIEQEVH